MGYLTLFAAFARIGLFGFGGGLAMLPLIYQSVQQFGFMDPSEFSDLLALSQVTPGAIAVNAATYVGLHYAGFGGGLIATLGVVFPEFVIMLMVCRFLDRFREHPLVEGAFTGIRPVTIGLLITAAIFVADGVLVKGAVMSPDLGNIDYYQFLPMGIAAATVVLMCAVKMKPIRIMLLMAAVGAVSGGFGLIG